MPRFRHTAAAAVVFRGSKLRCWRQKRVWRQLRAAAAILAELLGRHKKSFRGVLSVSGFKSTFQRSQPSFNRQCAFAGAVTYVPYVLMRPLYRSYTLTNNPDTRGRRLGVTLMSNRHLRLRLRLRLCLQRAM